MRKTTEEEKNTEMKGNQERGCFTPILEKLLVSASIFERPIYSNFYFVVVAVVVTAAVAVVVVAAAIVVVVAVFVVGAAVVFAGHITTKSDSK